MMGDSLLSADGKEAEDHITSIRELMKLKIKSDRSINILDNLRRLRHNIKYYGYRPGIEEINEVKSMAKSLFEPIKKEVIKKIK